MVQNKPRGIPRNIDSLPVLISDRNDMTIRVGSIPEGCADIARGLGLKPEETLFDFEWVTFSKNGRDSDYRDGLQEYQSILPLIRGGATGVTLKLHDGLLPYLQQHAGVSRVIEVTNTLPMVSSSDLYFPDHSLILRAHDLIHSRPELSALFNDKVYCACLPVREVEDFITALGGRTLIRENQTLHFNSKSRVVSQAAHEGYTVAPFVLVDNTDGLADGLNRLRDRAQYMGINPDTAKYWVKFDNLSGGDGVLPFTPATMDINDIKNWITEVMDSTDMPPAQLLPLVLDIDIGSLPGVRKIVGNVCVQGIVGDPGVTITGTTMQNTRNGVYKGGKMPETPFEKTIAREAFHWAAPVMNAAQMQGYRGYAGVDVIVVEREDGQRHGYVLEMNGRLNCSTSILSMAHWVERESGIADPIVENLYTHFDPVSGFDAFEDRFSDLMYRGEKSGFSGIVPVYLDFDESGAIHGAKLLAVAPDRAGFTRLEQKHARVLDGLRPGL